MSLEQQLVDLTREFNRLKQQFDNLTKPEVGGWVDFTPSLYQAAAVAATVNEARVFIDNKKATVITQLTATAAGTATNNIYILLPATLTPASGFSATQTLGSAIYLDTGTAKYYGVAAYLTDVGGLPAIGIFDSTTNDGNAIGTNPNIAIGNGDVASIDVTFEIA